MRFHLFIYLLLFCQLSYCQNQNYVDYYYPKINQAESFIVRKDYRKALITYNMVFNNTTNFFAKDIYNALICSLLLKKNVNAKKFLNLLLIKGVDIHFLMKIPILNTFIKNNNREIYDRLKPISKDSTLIKFLEILEKKDQEVRQIGVKLDCPLWVSDSSNAQSLINVINDIGFPNEDKIGFQGILPNEKLYMSIIMHQNQLYRTFNFSEILYEAVQKGALLPNTALILMFFQSEDDNFGIVCDYQKISKMQYQKINNHRQSWGVSDISQYAEKIQFSKKNRYFEFNLKQIEF